jgi:TRAP-type C4-dicarboxylate transport system permease small subunit
MLSSIDAVLSALNRALMAFTSALIMILALVIAADVVGRNLLLFALPWSAEFAEYGLYLSAILVSPWLLRGGKHITIDVLVGLLPHGLARLIALAADVLCAAVSFILGWYALNATLRSYSDGALVIKNIVFPEWWVLAPISVIFFILAIELAVLTVRRLGGPADLPT